MINEFTICKEMMGKTGYYSLWLLSKCVIEGTKITNCNSVHVFTEKVKLG